MGAYRAPIRFKTGQNPGAYSLSSFRGSPGAQMPTGADTRALGVCSVLLLAIDRVPGREETGRHAPAHVLEADKADLLAVVVAISLARSDSNPKVVGSKPTRPMKEAAAGHVPFRRHSEPDIEAHGLLARPPRLYVDAHAAPITLGFGASPL